MTKGYRAVPLTEVLTQIPAKRRSRIAARAAELIAEEMGLQELRKSQRMTQEQLAERLASRQVYVSRLEKRADMKLSTLREYVRAVGGELELIVTFPEGETVRLSGIGDTEARRRRPRRAPMGRE